MNDVDIKLTKRGVFVVDRETAAKRKVAAPIRVRALGKRSRDNVTFAEIRFCTMHGTAHSEFFEFSKLLSENRHQIKAKLADLGYDWPDDAELSRAILAAVIKDRPKRRFRFVDAPGWYDAAFVVPGQAFRSGNDSTAIYIDPETDAHVGPFTVGEGSLRDWKDHVAAPSRKSSRLRLSVAAALAAPFVRPLGLDSFGINWFSDTSDGKTTLLFAAASVAGLIGSGGLPGWADSELGIEGLARGHRDNILPLDEMADGEHEIQLNKKARMIAFLVARNRPRRLSRVYERTHGLGQREYRIILISTSERALGHIARAAGMRRLGGEEVRFIDVPASEPGSLGIFDEPIEPLNGRTGREATKSLVERIKADAVRYQGHALLAMMKRFMADPDGLKTLHRYKRSFEDRATVMGTHNAQYRVRTNFAVLYGASALAIDYGILPWKKGGTFRAIEKCMRLALAAMETGSQVSEMQSPVADLGQVCNQLKRRLETACIVAVKPKEKITEAQARDRQMADGFEINDEIFLKTDRFKQWIPAGAARNLLKANRVLRTERGDTSTVERTIAGISGKPRYYVIETAVLDAV